MQHALPLLTPSLLADAMEPLRVYWSCYLALTANSNVRADHVLQTAHRLVMDLASRIADPTLRHSFLNNIRVHREIEQAFADRPSSSELVGLRSAAS